MNEKTKIAIIGIGRWGKNLLREFASQAEVEYVFDKSPENTEWLKQNYPKIKTVSKFEDILNNNHIPAVIIATPINTHFEIAMPVLQSNKHLFLEKPGTDSSDKISKLIDIAREKSLIFQIGYEFVYHPQIAIFREIFNKEKVKSISFLWHKWGSFNSHPVPNLLVHELSILQALGLKNINITKYKETEGEYKPDSIYIEAISDSIQMTFDINRVSQTKEKTIRIVTENNCYEWKNDDANTVKEEVSVFLSSIETHKESITNGEFARQILKTIEQIKFHS